MAYNGYIKKKRIPMVQQKIDLLRRYPNGKAILKRGTLFWRAKLLPTPLSRAYTVEIEYSLKDLPKVYVTGSELKRKKDSSLPHNYGWDKNKERLKLCLYRYSQFNSSMLISKTLVPWAIEWLYYYEIWLSTGEWCGGGEHPKNKVKGESS